MNDVFGGASEVQNLVIEASSGQFTYFGVDKTSTYLFARTMLAQTSLRGHTVPIESVFSGLVASPLSFNQETNLSLVFLAFRFFVL